MLGQDVSATLNFMARWEKVEVDVSALKPGIIFLS